MSEQFTWTGPDGQVIDLTDEAAGYSVLANGTRGLRSVPWEFTTSAYAGIDGESVDAVKAGAGQVTLGLMVRAGSESEFRSRVRGLVRAMRPRPGAGLLTVRNDDGDARSLNCYGAGGLEGDESTDSTLAGSWWKVALKLYAPDPWWYGAQRTISAGLGSPNSFFPFFPLRLSPSTVQGQFTVDLSDADAPVYPLWTITGPGSALTLTNTTTGRVITVNAAIPDGETMIIDTRPGYQSVRRGNGTNLLGQLSSDPALWPLVEGENVVTAALLGASATSRIEGSYAPRYAGI